MIRLLFDSIIRRMKSFFFTVFLCVISLVLFALALYIYEDSKYCVENADKILNGGINKTGVLSLVNFIEIGEENIVKFRHEVYGLEEITTIGTAMQPGYIYSMLGELSQIQSKFIPMINNDSESVEGIIIDNTLIDLCDIKLESGEWIYDEEQDSLCTYLYLGHNLKEVSVGTQYDITLKNGLEIRLIVKGILEKGARFINPDIFSGNDDLLSDTCYTTMDNLVLAVDNTILNNYWLYGINDSTDFYDTELKIESIADKYGINLYYGKASGIIKERQIATQKENDMIIKLLVVITIVCLIIMICMQVTSILNNLSEYGILYANGYGIRKLCGMLIWENVIKMGVALIISLIIAKKLIIRSFFGMSTMLEVYNDIYNNTVIYQMMGICVLIVILASIVPVFVLSTYKPIELIGGNDT